MDENFDKWNVVEKYLPNYHSRNDVLYLDICYRYLHNEELDEQDREMIESDFSSKDAIEKYIDFEEDRLYNEALMYKD